MLRLLVDAVLHLPFKILEIIHHFRSLSLRSKVRSNENYFSKILNKFQSTKYEVRSNGNYYSKKKPRYFEAFFIRILVLYFKEFYFFFFSSRPKGRLLAKSTNTGAATKIEE